MRNKMKFFRFYYKMFQSTTAEGYFHNKDDFDIMLKITSTARINTNTLCTPIFKINDEGFPFLDDDFNIKHDLFGFHTDSSILIPGLFHSYETSILLCKNYYNPIYVSFKDPTVRLSLKEFSKISTTRRTLSTFTLNILQEDDIFITYEFRSIIYLLDKVKKILKILYLPLYDVDNNVLKIYVNEMTENISKKEKTYTTITSLNSAFKENTYMYGIDVMRITINDVAEFNESIPEDIPKLTSFLTMDDEGIESYKKRKFKKAYAKC